MSMVPTIVPPYQMSTTGRICDASAYFWDESAPPRRNHRQGREEGWVGGAGYRPAMQVDAVIFDWGGTLTRWHDIDFHAESLALAHAVVESEGEHAVHAEALKHANQ